MRIDVRALPVACALLLLTAGTPAQAADIFKGREVYELHCQTCHGIDGRSIEPGTPDFSRGESLFAPDSELVPPLALEIRLQLEDWGEMRRLYALPPY